MMRKTKLLLVLFPFGIFACSSAGGSDEERSPSPSALTPAAPLAQGAGAGSKQLLDGGQLMVPELLDEDSGISPGGPPPMKRPKPEPWLETPDGPDGASQPEPLDGGVAL